MFCQIGVNTIAIIFVMLYSYIVRECDSVIYPSIDKILNIVDSKYALVYVVSERAKQMTKTGYYQMPIKDYKCQKNIGRGLEEVYEGLIHIEKH